MPVAASPHPQESTAMDIELINALGLQLSDLARRTADLRGYL